MRPRTRSQWVQHYRNVHEELKKKAGRKKGKQPIGKIVKPETITVDEDSDVSLKEKPDFSQRRTRNTVHKFNLVSAPGKKEMKKNKVINNVRDLSSSDSSDDDDSGSGSGSEAGHYLDEVRKSGQGSGKSLSNPVDIDSDSSSTENEEAEQSSSEDESTSEAEEEEEEEEDEESEENDDSSDEDYKANEPMAISQSSDDDDTDFEQEKDDECGGGENENVMKEDEEEIEQEATTSPCIPSPIKGMRVNEKRKCESEEDDDDDDDDKYDGGENENVMKWDWDWEVDHTQANEKRKGETWKDEDIGFKKGNVFDKGNDEDDDDDEKYEGGENENLMKWDWEINNTRANEKRKSEKTWKDEIGIGFKKRKAFDERNDKEHTCFTKEDVENDKFRSKRDDYSCFFKNLAGSSEKVGKKKKKTCEEKSHEFFNFLVESINCSKRQTFPTEVNAAAFTQTTLPSRFRFEDDEMQQPPLEKTDSEKEVDLLFHELEFGLCESEINQDPAMNDDCTEIDTTPAARCSRGEHQPILDEQIGIVCEYCAALIMDIKYVLPPFYTPPPRRRKGKDSDDDDSPNDNSPIHFDNSVARETMGPTNRATGTVWDLIPGVEKEMYPHQREGFEFMWRNIAGDIRIDKLKHSLGREGCIISHAPGTGKTRLAIAFLATFLKLYPTCRPVIIAPRGMLLQWESEFVKWNTSMPFHNMNKEELSEDESAFASVIIAQIGGVKISREHRRWLKMCKWMRGGSILGITYQLFEKLTGENQRGEEKEKMRELLLKYPDLLVLDEGHTPRNDQSLIWKALTKVENGRCIILSGTPFQNNLVELYNILCLVNPNIMNSENSRKSDNGLARKRWRNVNRDDELKKLKMMLDPFVHAYKGTLLQESLPGLSNTLVFLKPTELQKTLLEASTREQQIFCRVHLVSMVSVHPSLLPEDKRSTAHKSQLEEIESDIEAGVKTQFIIKLIQLANALGERVLIFSQYIDPLMFIKERIKSRFSWNEGRELFYMDGQLDEKQRQDSISSFNDEKSEAKVLLASVRACSEGINLVGASRVVLLDIAWNPSVEKQAISRAYRLGQKKFVYVYRLFTWGAEVKQYAQQAQKERISQLLFSPLDGGGCRSDKSNDVPEDKVLEAMRGCKKFGRIFEKIYHQPKKSDVIEIFGLMDLK